MSKLIYSSDGSTLLHWFEVVTPRWGAEDSHRPNLASTFVDVWDTRHNQFRYQVPGYLIGASKDGRMFLTQRAPEAVSAWDIATGAEIPLEQIDPEAYPDHQRLVFSKVKGLQVHDVFGIWPPQRIALSDPVSNLVLGPYVFIAFWFDWGDIDGAYGHAIHVRTGDLAYTFAVDRHSAYVPLYFSTPHHMLFVGSNNRHEFVAYHLETGVELNSDTAKWVSRLLSKIQKQVHGLVFHPQGTLLAASLFPDTIGLWNINTGRKVKTLRKLP